MTILKWQIQARLRLMETMFEHGLDDFFRHNRGGDFIGIHIHGGPLVSRDVQLWKDKNTDWSTKTFVATDKTTENHDYPLEYDIPITTFVGYVKILKVFLLLFILLLE